MEFYAINLYFYASLLLPLHKETTAARLCLPGTLHIMTDRFHRIFSFLLVALTTATLVSCSDDSKTPDRVQKIARLDRMTYAYPKMDAARRSSLRDSLAPELSALVKVMELDSTANDEAILAWSDTQPVKIFSPLVDKAFPTLDSLEHTLGGIVGNAGDNGLKIPRYRFATVVWGKPKSIVFADSVALIALNHYLGSDSPAYANWPLYIRQQKRPELLPYDIAEAMVATAYPYKPSDAHKAKPRQEVETDPYDESTADDIPDMVIEPDGMLLNRMLYEGALVYAKTRLVPDADVTLALGFTPEQMRDVVANEEFAWNKIVSGKMLYSTDPELHDRLFNLLPNSAPISPQAPGRALRYIALQIVRAYVDGHKDVTLDFLLSPAFYNAPNTLREAGYTPAKK